MKVDTILFDWDGTLAQTLEVWLRTFKEAYAKVGVYPSDKDISCRFGNLNAHVELGVTPQDVEEYNTHLEKIYERLEKVELYPHAKVTLSSLKEGGYKLGLVSTSSLKMLSTALKNNGLENFFDVIISADDTDKHKPDPTPLLLALERLHSTTEAAVFVGDSDKDTGAANNANIPLLLFAPDKHNLYYDLDHLRAEPAVKASFDTWRHFPFGAIPA